MKKRIGDILTEMGFIGADQLEMALMETRKTGAMLGDVLLRLDWVTEEQLQMAIAVQSGAQILDTTGVSIDPGLLAEIPQEFVNAHGIFPFEKDGQTLKAATSNPFDVIARDQLARLTGYRVVTYIAPKAWIARAIALYYQTARTIDNEIEAITRAGLSERAAEENQIVTLADLLIDKGYVMGASDIHVVPDNNLVRVYYRIDGVLHQTYLFAKTFQQGLITRFKIMADMDISNPNIPHDGRIRYSGKVGAFDMRVSTFPTQLGETVVMRLLVYDKVVGELNNLGLEEEDLARFREGIRRPYGLILTTGPTGSGKTTTLYTALMAINSPHINVMTVEDPIEYAIPTIRQTAVNPKAGLGFGNALRSAMRQDPDVILVGEIRDRETADLALQAALTGHLVLSTLHTNDAASAINRLLDLGVNTSILTASLSMVVAQRLVRRVCPHCVQRVAPTPEEAALFSRQDLTPPPLLARAVGCGSCYQSGYRGRTGIYEVLRVDRAIGELIFGGALHSTIEDAAVKAGTSLMYRQALKKAVQGVTTLEEVFRVAADA
jgi:type IV pilus assembly protein PilB